MPRRSTDFRGLSETNRVRLLGAVQDAPGSTLKELAERLGLHVNTTRDHLATLVNEGLVAVGSRPSKGRGRPPATYSPVVDPSTNRAASERVARSQETTERLRPVLVAVAQGTKLGRDAAQQLDVLFEHLADTGLEPEVSDDVLQVKLVPCQFFRIVFEDQEFACQVHRQLLRDILSQVEGPIELDELVPFTEPDACVVRLRHATAGRKPHHPRINTGSCE
jgi:predicted ArsR family transcriptional regulator